MFPSDEAVFKILYFSLTKYQLVTHTEYCQVSLILLL